MRHFPATATMRAGACVLVGFCWATQASAQSLVFHDKTIGDIVFSGLSLFTAQETKKGRGLISYQMRCIATTSQPDTETTFGLTYQVMSKDNRILKSFGTPSSGPNALVINRNGIAHCGQGSGAFADPGVPPDHIGLQVTVSASLVVHRLDLNPGGLPNLNFKDISIGDLTFSNLALAVLTSNGSPQQPMPDYRVSCQVKTAVNTVRQISNLEFFAYSAANAPPFVAIPVGPPISVTNGVFAPCYQGTGPIPDPGFTPTGMAMQYSESTPLTSKMVQVLPIGRK